MTSDGYRLALESAVRDAKEETRREYAERLRGKDREIAALELRVNLLKHRTAVQDEEISRLRSALSETLEQL